jgi:hypothetical protein
MNTGFPRCIFATTKVATNQPTPHPQYLVIGSTAAIYGDDAVATAFQIARLDRSTEDGHSDLKKILVFDQAKALYLDMKKKGYLKKLSKDVNSEQEEKEWSNAEKMQAARGYLFEMKGWKGPFNFRDQAALSHFTMPGIRPGIAGATYFAMIPRCMKCRVGMDFHIDAETWGELNEDARENKTLYCAEDLTYAKLKKLSQQKTLARSSLEQALEPLPGQPPNWEQYRLATIKRAKDKA